MGIFSAIIQGATAAANLAYQIQKDQHLTGAEREANEFSAQQADLDRRFQSAEAEKARDWQESQYLLYNSPAAQMRQFQQAGINPALMFGDPATPASTQTSAPAGAAVSSVTPSGGDIVGIIGQMLNMSKLEAEIDRTKSESERNRASALLDTRNAAWVDTRSEADLQEIASRIGVNLSKIDAQGYENALNLANTLKVFKETSWIDRVNEAHTEAEKASAARDMAEAAISEMEKAQGHRLGSNSLLVLADAIMSKLGIDPKSSSPIGDIIAETIEKQVSKSVPLEDAIGGRAGGAIFRGLKKKWSSFRNKAVRE